MSQPLLIAVNVSLSNHTPGIYSFKNCENRLCVFLRTLLQFLLPIFSQTNSNSHERNYPSMSYDPLSSHLTDQKQEGATAKQTKLSPDLLGGSFSFILCCCQNKAWDVVVIYLFDIISITHTVEWWEISWYQQHRSLIGGGEHKDSGHEKLVTIPRAVYVCCYYRHRM